MATEFSCRLHIERIGLHSMPCTQGTVCKTLISEGMTSEAWMTVSHAAEVPETGNVTVHLVGELGELEVTLVPSNHRFAPESADNFQELLLSIGALKNATFSVEDNSMLNFQKFSHAVIIVRDYDGQKPGRIENEYTFFMQCVPSLDCS
jgi:hypothetical protein